MKNFLHVYELIGWEKTCPSIFMRISVLGNALFIINGLCQFGVNFLFASSWTKKIRFKTLSPTSNGQDLTFLL